MGTNENRKKMDWLLIVPYGIETCHNQQQHGNTEAFNRTLWN